jgi:hypothetical protein
MRVCAHLRTNALHQAERTRCIDLQLHGDQLERGRGMQAEQRGLLGEGHRREGMWTRRERLTACATSATHARA